MSYEKYNCPAPFSLDMYTREDATPTVQGHARDIQYLMIGNYPDKGVGSKENVGLMRGLRWCDCRWRQQLGDGMDLVMKWTGALYDAMATLGRDEQPPSTLWHWYGGFLPIHVQCIGPLDEEEADICRAYVIAAELTKQADFYLQPATYHYDKQAAYEQSVAETARVQAILAAYPTTDEEEYASRDNSGTGFLDSSAETATDIDSTGPGT